MPLPIVLVSEFAPPAGGIMLMTATPTNGIENRQYPRRFYNFNMVITKPFSFDNINQLTLTDNASVDIYHLVDRLGNPVLAEQLQGYASNRKCICCQFDSVKKVIRVLSCICPTNHYIQQWLNPPASAEEDTETNKDKPSVTE